MPVIGESAVFRISGAEFGEYTMRVVCVKAAGRQREFEVAFVSAAGRCVSPYRVLIAYERSSIPERRITVTDRHGKPVPRGTTVDGYPVPFSNTVFLPGDRLPREGVMLHLPGGWAYRHRCGSYWRADRPRHTWMFFDGGRGRAYIENQEWEAGSWLWTSVVRSSDVEGDPSFSLFRKTTFPKPAGQ